MKAFLAFVSALLLTVNCFAQRSEALPTTMPVLPRSEAWATTMQARGHEFTGLCIIEQATDGTLVGTLVNEMGVKAFDFTYANGKAKVLNVIAPLDKWYIRKVLRGDLTFILSNINKGQDADHKKRHLRLMPNGDISVSNDRFKIKYTFTPTHETD